MKKNFSIREFEIYNSLIDKLQEKRSAADLILLEALAIETALYEEATMRLCDRKVLTQGVKHEIPSAWVTIRNNALKNMQNITKLLGISELGKSQEQPTAKIAKLDILKNGKKNIIQKAAN
jgi:hypothetical protein